MSEDPDVRRIQHAVAALGEHFESVAIIATRTDNGSTAITHAYRGNFYAAKGSVREWLERNDERSRESIRHENDCDE